MLARRSQVLEGAFAELQLVDAVVDARQREDFGTIVNDMKDKRMSFNQYITFLSARARLERQDAEVQLQFESGESRGRQETPRKVATPKKIALRFDVTPSEPSRSTTASSQPATHRHPKARSPPRPATDRQGGKLAR